MSDPLLHLSCTKYDMLGRCEFAFMQRYILGYKTRPGSALIFGRADDETKNDVYKHKINVRETRHVGVVREKFAASWEDEIEKANNDVDWQKDDRGKLKDLGVNLVAHWRDRVAVNVNPIRVQGKFLFPIKYSHQGQLLQFDFLGHDDLVEEIRVGLGPEGVKRIITDNKTSGKKWSANKTAESTQGVAYGLAAERDPELRTLGIDPGVVHFHVAVKSNVPHVQHPSTDPKVIRVTDATERAGFAKMLAKAHIKIRANMQSGNWMPNRTHFLCSKKWCGYWRECQAEHGGVIKE